MAFPLVRSCESDRFSTAFARTIGAAASKYGTEAPATLVGLEHEFRVLVAERPIDFRRLIHELPIDGRRVDPADPNAYRGSWGGTITCDGREAEIAIPPVATVPGFSSIVVALTSLGRERLRAALPADATLEGYSTHLSVAVPDRLVERAARLYTETFAPALMLLLDGPASPGLLIRPRPGRLELGGEFADGERLRAAVAFVVGSVRAVARAAGRPILAYRRLPPAVFVRSEPAIERYGWFVAPSDVAPDLYRAGRRARLRLRRGGTVSAQAHLERCWAIARAALGTGGDPADIAALDRIVAGAAPLGIELEQARAIAQAPPDGGPIDLTAAAHPFGALVRVRHRGDLRIEPALVCWDFAILRVSDGRRTGFACLPRPALGSALAALDAGRLDGALAGFLAASDAGRALDSARKTRTPGLYGTVGGAARLLVPERPPLGEIGDRPGKRRRRDDRQDQTEPSNAASVTRVARPITAAAAGGAILGRSILGRSIPVAAVVAGVALVAVVGGALVLGGGLAGGSPAPVALASVEPSLASPSGAASIVAIASPSPIVSPSATAAPLNPFAGTFEVSWTVMSEAHDPAFPDQWPKGSTGTQLVMITCAASGCEASLVTASGVPDTGESPLRMATGGPWPLTSDGRLTHTYAGGEPQCGPTAKFTESATYIGADAVQSGGTSAFGGFTGSASVKYQQLRTATCAFYDHAVEFAGVRVGP